MTCQNCSHTLAAHTWKDYPERSDCGQPCDCTAYREPEPAVTDLPDAVVEAAAEAMVDHRIQTEPSMPGYRFAYCICRWRSPDVLSDEATHLGLMHEARAALAAASGPWAEHLDAASPATEYVEQVAADNDRLEADLAAALARNAELEAEVEEQRQDLMRRDSATYARIKERDAARAELDNLRDRVTELADEWDGEGIHSTDPLMALCDHEARAVIAQLRAAIEGDK